MALALLLGLTFGLAAVLSWRLLFPPAPPLSAAIERFRRRSALGGMADAGEAPEAGDTVVSRLAASVGQALIGLGLSLDHLEPDLRLLGRSIQQHMVTKLLMAAFGLALPQLVVLITLLSGGALDLLLPSVASLVLGPVFFFLPDTILRSEAAERRKALRHSLSSFLDLVVISLAGGAGVESALRDAAEIGGSWAFVRVRAALDGAAFTGQTPWVALTALGEDLGVTELVELSASVALAGAEGARVRDSLAAKAASLRDHALAEVESEAQASTERMAVPQVLLLLGFVLLIGYPAASLIMGG